MTNEHLRKEWKSWLVNANEEFKKNPLVKSSDDVADFWLSKIDEMKREIIEDVEKMKTCDEKECYKDHNHHFERMKDEIFDKVLALESLKI